MPHGHAGGRVGASSELVRDVAVALRDRVVPLLGSAYGRTHSGRSEGAGDITFAIDAEAERFLVDHLARNAPDVAFYSEDRGLVLPAGIPSDGGTASDRGANGPGGPSGTDGAGERSGTDGAGGPSGTDRAPATVLVVDPIDGTRPALAGLESCCVSVAAAPYRRGVTMGDVAAACVVEIPSGAVFLAERGTGLLEAPPPRLSQVDRVERMFWAYGFRGRPARATTEVLAELIDASSVGGATFDLGSAAFDMTRVLTGQLDAYVEPGPRMIAEVPGLLDEFRDVGGGAVLNNSPYDLAAAFLCLVEAGAVVTDATGEPLDNRPLLGSDHIHQMSVVACANGGLHRRVIEALDAGIERLRRGRGEWPAGLAPGLPRNVDRG